MKDQVKIIRCDWPNCRKYAEYDDDKEYWTEITLNQSGPTGGSAPLQIDLCEHHGPILQWEPGLTGADIRNWCLAMEAQGE